MISNIRLQNYRSYKDASFEFEPGVNVIVGPNASGKTNLLEAILVVAQGKSYRAKDAELIRHKQPWARLDTDIESSHRVVKIEHAEPAAKKSFEIDGKSYSRLSAQKALPAVLFEPNHLLMLGGSPELRRNFIDALIAQAVLGYDSVLRNYRRVLSQRNRLLKHGPATADSQLFAWDIRLSELGSQIAAARQDMIKRVNKTAHQTYSELAKTPSKLALEYSNTAAREQYASQLLKRLAKDRDLDMLRGFTGAGPHREDIHIYLNKQPLSSTASRGETRTTLLTLKIIEVRLVEAARQQKPILLLDDVFSELDGGRRKALTEFMRDYQTFITTTDADIIQHEFAQKAKVITL